MPDITFTVDEELARWFVDNHEATGASRNHPLSRFSAAIAAQLPVPMPPEPDVPFVALTNSLIRDVRSFYVRCSGSLWMNAHTHIQCDWPHIVRVARDEGLSITLPGETVL